MLRDAHARFVIVGVAQDLAGEQTRPSWFAVARLLGGGACAGGPKPGCRVSLNPRQSVLLLRDPVTGGDRLLWQWRAGAATTTADFGDPVTRDDYTLCLFDARGAPLVSALGARGGLWRTALLACARDDVAYRDRTVATASTPSRSRPGASGAATIEVAGRGERLGLPDLPPELPLTVQLLGPQGVCWQATYAAPAVRSGGPHMFRARATE